MASRCARLPAIYVITLLLCLLAVGAAADDLVLVKDGQPNATILVPENEPAYTHGQPAFDLQQYIAAHTGAKLPIAHEGREPVKSTNIISVGHTKLAKAKGLDASKLPADCGYIRRVDNVLFLIGRDVQQEQAFSGYSSPHVRRLLGTQRTVVHFMREVLGYRFFFPGTAGAWFPPTEAIAVGQLDVTTPKPLLRFGQGGGLAGTGMIPYRINLGGMNQDLMEYHGGHSYDVWVPSKVYFKEHPDWYRMEKGIRTGKGGHVCPTSEGLKQHAIACMRKVAARGFKLLESNYADGWLWCECPRCMAALKELGLSQDREGAKELMHLLMRDTCLALRGSHPGSKVMVVAYGPLRKPPLSFKSYPDNVVLQLAYSDPEACKEWEGVGQRFAAYVYYWTFANSRAMIGVSNLYDMAEHARAFIENGYEMIYFCGAPINAPVEGPGAYVTGRILSNPKLTADELLHELCDKMFGPARDAMKAFYRGVHRRIQIGDRVQRKSGARLSHYQYYTLQWPTAELEMLQMYLDRARSLAGNDRARLLLDWVQDGFSLIDQSARLVHVYQGYLADPDLAKLAAVEQMVRRRAALIERIFAERKKYANLAPILKPGLSKQAALMGGESTNNQLRSPLTWDFEQFRKEGFLPGKSRCKLVVAKTASPPTIDGSRKDPVWAKANSAPIRFVSGGRPAVPTEIRALYDSQALYVLIDADEPLIEKLEDQPYGRDGNIYGNECSEILLDPQALGALAYHFIVGPQRGGLMDEKVLNGGESSDRAWNADVKWAHGRDLEGKAWRIEIAIPFAELGVTAPKEGEFWLANFTRTTRPYAFGLGRYAMPERFMRKHNSWSPILGVTKYADPKGMGVLWFGREAGR